MRVAVVGHVEWIRFCRVESMPARGEIAHSVDDWEQVGGGGGVAAIQLARLGAETMLFTVLGNDEDLPWHELATVDAVFFVAGDQDALVRARRSHVLVATSREMEVLRRGGVQLDALVGSGRDEAERYHAGDIDQVPDLVVSTS